MAVLLKDLLEGRVKLKPMEPRKCPGCGALMAEMIDGVCDCEYEELGKVIEQHPICTPRVRRG